MTAKLDHTERARLRLFFVDWFSLNDLKDLAFDCGVDSERFPNEKQAFSRELIEYFDNRDQAGYLVAEALNKRPDKDLAQLFAKLLTGPDDTKSDIGDSLPERLPPLKRPQIQLILDGEISSFTNERRDIVRNVLATILQVKPSEIVMLRVESGSVRLIIEVPEEAQGKLNALSTSGESQLVSIGVRTIVGDVFGTLNLVPFVYTGPVLPEHFIGHRWAVDNCRTHLAARQPASIAISGERKIGKTSLLHLIRKYGQKPDWGQHFCLFLDCLGLSGNINPLAFWRAVLSCVQTQASLDPTSPVLAQIADLQKRSELPYGVMAHFFTNFCQSYSVQSFVLLLDEVELILKNYNQDVRDLLQVLRDLILTPDSKFALVTVTRKPLGQLCQDFEQDTGLQFASNLVPCNLYPFDREETERVVQTLLAKTHVEFSADELSWIWLVSHWRSKGALPARVQLASSLIFGHKRNSASPIDYNDLRSQFREAAANILPGDMVFLSCAREDMGKADATRASLEDAGYTVWQETTDVKGGQIWLQEVEEAIDQCTAFIPLISNAYKSSHLVQKEFLAAEEKRKLIIPLFLEDCDPPLRIRGYQFIDCTSGMESCVEELLRAFP